MVTSYNSTDMVQFGRFCVDLKEKGMLNEGEKISREHFENWKLGVDMNYWFTINFRKEHPEKWKTLTFNGDEAREVFKAFLEWKQSVPSFDFIHGIIRIPVHYQIEYSDAFTMSK
ncbi:MAG: hypothetical protein ACRCST_01530 [Turicibacter sp.]